MHKFMLIVLFSLIAFSPCLEAKPGEFSPIMKKDVLSVHGNGFFLDLKPFAEISFNKFDLFWHLYNELKAGNAIDDENPLVKAQDKALRELHEMGFRSIRFFAFPYGSSGHEPYSNPENKKLLYEALDKTVELLEKNQIRAVWSLGAGAFTDTRHTAKTGWVHGEEHKRELIADPKSKSRMMFYRYLDETVERYKYCKEVLMWEVSNEMTNSADIGGKERIYKDQRMPTLDEVAGFFDDVANRIKMNDQIRIVNSGGSHLRECAWNLSLGNGWKKDTLEEQFNGYELLYKKTAIDVIDIHSYMNNKPGYVISDGKKGEVYIGFKDWMSFSKLIGKPLMLGEFGLAAAHKEKKKKIWEATPDYFESYADTEAAKPWVEKTLNAVIEAEVPLSYWWCYSSDRPMDQKNPQRFDLTVERNPELMKLFVEANKRLKEKLLHHKHEH